MTSSKPIKTTIILEKDIEVWNDVSESFVLNQPSKYFVQLATGDLLFIHTRDRLMAQEYIDSEYGKGFYLIKQCKSGAGSGNYTCVGTATRARPSSRPPK